MQGVGVLVNSNGWKSNLDGTVEGKWGEKTTWKGVLKADLATPDLGGAKLATSVSDSNFILSLNIFLS